jgi:L-aspartate oxidase
VLVATGGYGQLFAVTTNPTRPPATASPWRIRAGVAVADVEFEQFHPTALHHPVMPGPLLTEALRGHGACCATRTASASSTSCCRATR